MMTYMYHVTCRGSHWDEMKQCRLIGCGYFHQWSWQKPHDHAAHVDGFEGVLHPLPVAEDAQALAAHNAADAAKHITSYCSTHRKPRSFSSLVDDGDGGLCCKPSTNASPKA